AAVISLTENPPSDTIAQPIGVRFINDGKLGRARRRYRFVLGAHGEKVSELAVGGEFNDRHLRGWRWDRWCDDGLSARARAKERCADRRRTGGWWNERPNHGAVRHPGGRRLQRNRKDTGRGIFSFVRGKPGCSHRSGRIGC